MLRIVALGLIRFYQAGISPFTPPSCRFSPTCSAYAFQAIERFGFWRGLWLFLKRLFRCHPWGGEGFDPVPEHFGCRRTFPVDGSAAETDSPRDPKWDGS